MNFRQLILQHQLSGLFQLGTFGLEKEGHRVDENGHVVQTMHPTVFGNRSTHPYIQTDYAESQLELITPTVSSSDEAVNYLEAIHEVVLRQLDGEWLYNASLLAHLPEESAILEAQISEQDTKYREYLSEKYGKYQQMMSGIHYNFGFSPEFITQLANIASDGNEVIVKNAIYLKLARQFQRYQWLLIYLFGSSISVDERHFKTDKPLNRYVRSLRSSEFGYVNAPHIQVSFETMAKYAQTLQQYVDSGDLIAKKEFYAPIRFRGEKHAKDFVINGVSYVELRVFDINPFAPVGITKQQARFVHLFILLMIWLDETDESIQIGQSMARKTALETPLSHTEFEQEGQQLFHALRQMADALNLDDSDKALIHLHETWLTQPQLTVGGQLAQAYLENSPEKVNITLSKQQHKQILSRSYGLQAFNHLELSTQALIEDAIRLGIAVSILDANDQFLVLKYGQHEEYVKNGNMTRLDAYISPLIMENKVVTKKVLSRSGFNVPKSIEVTSIDEAKKIYALVQGKPIVIKPKSTNYGLGITIFKEGALQNDFLEAVEIALKEDKEVMIESFIEGTEYRFFVVNGKTEAVLLRVGAHVVGDGVSTIAQLVAQKNEHPLRGDGLRSPLKKIQLGAIEKMQLKEQGFTIDSVPEKNVIVQLRENSNISTGGDSIDMTDDMHESYKIIAGQVANAMFATFCGVDMMIPDYRTDAAFSSGAYGIIEANFNPMMMMHIYPAKGQSRRLTVNVLKQLFPEYPW